MLCSMCQHPNDEQARFCNQCGQPLDTRCPACNTLNGVGARFCSQCGQPLTPPTILVQPLAGHPPTLEEKLDRLQRYLPAHLADKILAQRGRLVGERKLVTVLFADLVGYSTLSAQMGEEALFTLMDDLYEQLIHAVHRFEGTVNELTGDGIVAFFGAPLAVEQAPQRAVRAALALQEVLSGINDRIAPAYGLQLQLRVGLNTGPVIVGTVGNNLRMDYKAVGHTVNLAARMEQTAAPGTIQLTAQTYKLVAGYFDCEDLGLLNLKGLPEKVRAYRVTGEQRGRARLEVARERGFTRLVGRQRELDMLQQRFALAQGGRGQAVSIIGDAGLGKSRLLYEFRQTVRDTACTWLDGRCHPYGTALAYGPIVEVLKQHMHLDASDRNEDIGAKVRHGLESLDPTLLATAPYLFHLLAAETDGAIPPDLSPEAIKHHIFEALRQLMEASAARQPLVLAIEDLHWIDPTSTECLTFLLEHLAGAQVLLVCTYRPDFASLWSRKSYHRVITLTPLAAEESTQMLTALLGTPRIQGTLASLVLDKADGVPFFLEELVKSLQETGAIVRQDEQWRLTPGATTVPVPETVEEVLMARIDRLPEGARSVLQIGAVLGREGDRALLQEVVGLPEQELAAHLSALAEAELLYTRSLPPQTAYLFKHAFTQDAAYHSLLTTRRCALHHRVAVTLEALFADRLEEYAGQLAYHYCEAMQEDEVDKAMAYAMRAGERSMALPAYTEAIRFYHMALLALQRQASVDEAQHSTLLLALGEAQRKASDLLPALETFRQAAESARRSGSAEHFTRAALEFELTTWRGLLFTEEAVHLLRQALRMLGEADGDLRARALGSLSRALLYLGVQEQAREYAHQAMHAARRVGDPDVLAFILGCLLNLPWEGPEETATRLGYATEMVQHATTAGDGELASQARHYRMVALLELGSIQEVDIEIEAMMQQDEKLQQPAYLHGTTLFRSMRASLDGRFVESERLASEASALGQRAHADNESGMFGLQMFTLRRAQGRLAEIEVVLKHFVQQHGAASAWQPGLALLYSELGRVREARTVFERLAQHDFVDVKRDGLWVGCMAYLAEVCASLGDAARAATLYQLLLPYAGRTVVVGGGVVCYGAASYYLGILATTMAQWDAAEQHFADAVALNTHMGARPWLAYTQHAYATMLLTRNQPGDRERATALLDEALTAAGALGMRVLEARLTGQQVLQAVPAAATPGSLDVFSAREIEVLRLVATGKSNREIAEALCISLNTVATHVRNILTKIGAANRTEAAAYAVRHGVLAV